MTDTAEAQRVTDGRVQRRVVNRQALLKAGVDLAMRGHWHASAAEIAKEAGVSTRTFFMAFDGLEGYREELIREYEGTLYTGVHLAVESPEEGRWEKSSLLRLVLLGKSTPAP